MAEPTHFSDGTEIPLVTTIFLPTGPKLLEDCDLEELRWAILRAGREIQTMRSMALHDQEMQKLFVQTRHRQDEWIASALRALQQDEVRIVEPDLPD